MKQKELEMLLQRIKPHPSPSPGLEQYATPADVAAEALYFAFGQGDIQNKKLVDPGCGSGVLAIGAKLLGASDVIALDVDELSVETAMKNAADLRVDVCFLTMDFESFPEKCDTVIMNPPFGAQKGNLHADMVFLNRAHEVGDVIYSFHKAETLEYVQNQIKGMNRTVTHILNFIFRIPHQFEFHKKEVKEVDVAFLRITR